MFLLFQRLSYICSFIFNISSLYLLHAWFVYWIWTSRLYISGYTRKYFAKWEKFNLSTFNNLSCVFSGSRAVFLAPIQWECLNWLIWLILAYHYPVEEESTPLPAGCPCSDWYHLNFWQQFPCSCMHVVEHVLCIAEFSLITLLTNLNQLKHCIS